MKCKAAQAMVKCLLEESVEVVFGLPGAAICPFYDALSQSGIRHILVRQEQNAGHAASGYARMTGRPAVCIATSGPGALNLITAVATAYMDSVPLVVITGQVETGLLGRDVFQEADITGSCEPFVKHSYLVKDAAQIPRIFKEAFHIAGTGRRGPVLIDVPVDVQKTVIEYEYPKKAEIRSYKPNLEGHPGQIKRMLSALSKCKRPLICAGGGVFAAGAQEELLQLSKQAAIPMVTTMMGISGIPPLYERYLGMIGMHGAPQANRAMNAADLLILVGARVGDRAIMSPMGLSQTTTIVHIDIDPAEIGKNMATDIPIVGDAKRILAQANEKLGELAFPDWTAEFRLESPPLLPGNGSLRPRHFLTALNAKLPPDAVWVADVGQNQIWSARSYALERGRFLTSGGMGTMGYAIPAACGAKLACPKREVVAVCGDGAFQMEMMELATICQNRIPIKIVLMNNCRLGMVRELQDRQYGGNETAVSLDGNPDFIRLAQAYGIPARRITEDPEIMDAIDEMLETDGPFLLECAVSPAESTL